MREHAQIRQKHSHGEGVLSIDSYAYVSAIRHWNAAFKIIFAIVTLLLCVLLNNLLVSALVLFAMTYLCVVKSGIEFHEWIDLLKIPLVFVLLAVAAVVFEFSKEAQGWCISFGFTYLYTTPHMLIKGLFLFVRVMGAVSAMYFMTLTTPVHELIGVLRRFHVPAMFVELMYLIYRYIFILLETQRKMRISAESRLGFCDYRTSLKSFANIAGNLLIVSLQRAGNYYDAMESRCYDGALLFLEEKKPLDKRMVMRAVLFDSVLVLVAIALKLLWRN